MLKYANTYLRIISNDHDFRRSLVKNFVRLHRLVIRQLITNKHRGLILINLTEHMGDIIATEPVTRYLRQRHPGAMITWCVNEKFVELVRYNKYLDQVITVTCIAEWILLKKIIAPIIKVYDLHLDGRSCSTYKLTNKNKNNTGITIFNYLGHGNLLQVFSRTAGIQLTEDPTPEFHFSSDKDDEVIFPFTYIVFHTLANDPERNWSDDQWNALLSRILEQYPEIHVVEIGLNSILINSSPRFHNLVGNYNLQQIAHVIRRAHLFVGIESGFGHFANALGTNSLIMIGHYQQYKNYQVYSGRFAQGKDVTLYYHPGTLSLLKMEEVWPSVESRINIRSNLEKLICI